MSSCMNHPNWILGCQKSKIITAQKLNERRKLYYKNPKLCKYCRSVISYEKRDNTFCDCECSGFLATKGKHHSTEIKNKIAQGVINHNKLNLDMYDEDGNKRLKIKKCRICGNTLCSRPEICSKRKLFPTLSKYFGFNMNLVGSIKIYDEWDRIRSILDNDYNVLNLSSIAIAKKYNYYDCGNMCGILTRLGITRRNHSDSLNLAFIEGRASLTKPRHIHYKHG